MGKVLIRVYRSHFSFPKSSIVGSLLLSFASRVRVNFVSRSATSMVFYFSFHHMATAIPTFVVEKGKAFLASFISRRTARRFPP
jgi:hypothetical protein